MLDDGAERQRVEGLARDRLAALVAETGATLRLDGLPAMRPGNPPLGRVLVAHPIQNRTHDEMRDLARQAVDELLAAIS